MNNPKKLINLKTFAVALCLEVALIPAFSTVAQAGFKVPNRDAPLSSGGGGARSACVKSETPLTALTPGKSMPLTVTAKPTFFVYLPKTAAKKAEFVLKDEDENDVYRTMISIPSTPGIFSFKLPSTRSVPSLEVGKDYHWYLSLVCKAQDRREDVFVDGWIQRVQLTSDLAKASRLTPQARIDVYSNAGIWHEALGTLVDLRRSRPNDAAIATKWQEFLNSVGLENLSQKSLAQ